MATLIYDIDDLQNINNDLTEDYELMNDIDATGFAFVPIGATSPYFSGSLDGNGYVVRNLSITVSGAGNINGAMIDRTTTAAVISNLGVVDCDVTVTATLDGVTGRADAAGFIRHNRGTITNCYSTGTVRAIGPTSGGQHTGAGGFAIVQYGGSITNCYSTANVYATAEGRDASVGGFANSIIAGSISRCYATGNGEVVAGRHSYGGGFMYQAWSGDGIADCYARGDVSATSPDTCAAAGFSQQATYGIVFTNCYSTGTPTATSTGGFCQDSTTYGPSTFTACFWDTQTSGQATSDGGTGKTTAQMKQLGTFSAWSIARTTAANPTGGYPFLGWQIGLTNTWLIYGAGGAISPRIFVPIEDKVSLELVRNVEMSAGGRAFIDKEGNFHYDSRFGRHT